MGAGELIVLLLSLSAFGVSPNANAPSAQDVQKYAPESADLIVHLDLEAVVPGNWKAFTNLPNDPAVQASPELARELGDVLTMARGALEMAKATVGFDPVEDLDSITAWAAFADERDPSFLVVARGSFPADVIDKMQRPDPQARAEKIDGRTFLTLPDGLGLGQAADGAIIFGTHAWAKERVGATWRPRKAKKGGLSDRSAAWLDARPFFYVGSVPSAGARKRVLREMTDEDTAVIREAFLGHEFAAFAFSATGLAWTYDARETGTYDNAVLASEGMVSMLRAGHHATRGLAQIVLAALPAYAPFDETVTTLVKRRADLLGLVWRFSGDGNFAAQIDKNAADRSVTVRATGKSLSEVVPLVALAVPGFWMALARGSSEVVHDPVEARPMPLPPPAKKKAK